MLDEDLPERLPRPLLLLGRLRERFLADEAELEEDVTDPPLGPVSRSSVAGATVMTTCPAWESAVRSGHRSGHTGTRRLQGPHESYRRANRGTHALDQGTPTQGGAGVCSHAHAKRKSPQADVLAYVIGITASK